MDPEKRTVQILEVGVGLWRQGILGSWDPDQECGVWTLQVYESLVMQTAYPVRWGPAGGAPERAL